MSNNNNSNNTMFVKIPVLNGKSASSVVVPRNSIGLVMNITSFDTAAGDEEDQSVEAAIAAGAKTLFYYPAGMIASGLDLDEALELLNS